MDRLNNDVGAPTLGDYARRLRRHWWVLLLNLLIGVAAGAVLLSVSPKSYASDTSVLVTEVTPLAGNGSTANGRTQTAVNLDTESQLVGSAQVAARVQSLLHVSTSVADLQQGVSVTVPPNSAVLDIQYTGSTALAAQQASHAFAAAYLADRSDTAKQQLAATVTGLQAQLTQAQAQLKTVTDQSAALVVGSPDRANADAQRTVISNQVTDLLSQIAPLQAAVPTPGQIISDATLPSTPSSPVPALDLGGGLIAGLLLGLGVAVLLDSRDRRLRRPADVARLVGVPLLADLPSDLTRREFPGDSHAKVFDRLRTAVVDAGGGTVVVQVADPGERGASDMVALQLARSIARVHGRVVLVVAHVQSGLPELVGAQGRPGLVQVLRGERSATEACLHLPSSDGIAVLPPGAGDDQLEGLLQSPRMAAVLAELLGSATVVVATGGIGESAGAQAVSGESDTVVIVAERGRADSRVVTADADAAVAVGARVGGVVLVAAVGRPRRPAAGAERPFDVFAQSDDAFQDTAPAGSAQVGSRAGSRVVDEAPR